MTIDRDQIMKWLADDDGWSLRRLTVDKASWNDREWRAEYLCKRAAGRSFHHVHDEEVAGGKVKVWFVYESP